ncbi:MAG: serine/threonine-protein kinase [Vicinamibacteria bacterium]|nr:serine/threonine-protein kinase [Vicinamibacteria bacterium]
MTLSAGQRLGVYEIVAPLGAGGMGEVFRARDTRLGREVALKVLPEALAHDRNRLSRFEQEARAASALNHPNIVTIHDIGRESETSFIAMELVDGKTLRELEASGPLPVRRILNIAAQVAAGLAKAHEAGIVHRDLKPDNVMVSKDGFVKILDFGLAKLVESRSGEVSAMLTLAEPETHPGTVMGTVAYMSPEQASGELLDYRSDQFSLGSMLYEMTTGRKAFQRKTAAETMSAIIRDEPEPVVTLRPDLPLPLRWVLERCLSKDRDERYDSTQDLARDLARVRDHLSEVSSGTEAMLAAAGRGKPRRRALALLAGLALLSSGLVAGWGLTRKLAPLATAPSFQRLTFSQGELGNARFAPDGQTVVYGARLGPGLVNTQLYQTRAGSPESEKFKFPGDILAISPSNELAILNIGDQNQEGTLARVPISGGTPREVLEQVSYAGADFSPDGKELAVARVVDGKARLEFPVGKVLVPDGAFAPRFSRDGASIAFWEDQSGSFAVSVIDRLGKSKQTLSAGWPGFSGVPCWNADGREIWFTASQPGELEALWSVDLLGNRRLVTRVPGSLELDDVSREGHVLIAHHTITRTVRLASAADPTERELSWLDASFAADLSSDGRTLLLNEQGEGSGSGAVIYLRATDGSPVVKLGDGVAHSLSPDAKWVLMSDGSIGGKAGSLSLLPTGPGQTRALDPDGLTDFGGGAWLPDGTGVVFSASKADGVSHLYVQAVPDGKPRPIGPERTRLPPLGSPVSPNGKYVVGLRAGQVLLVPLDGANDARVVAGIARPADRVAQWTSDSQALYVYQYSARRLTVWLLDLKTGQRRPWKEIPMDSPGGRVLHVTPDGNTWVHSGRQVQSALYLVEGLR